MRFVPVQLDPVDCTIFQTDSSNAFELAPTPCPERFTQASQFAYSAADSDYFNLFEATDNLKVFVHAA